MAIRQPAQLEQKSPARRSVFLAAAFTALLLVLGVSVMAVWRNASNARERVAELHNAHMRAWAALAAIRANVYRAGILTRDYLLDSDPSHVVLYIEQFDDIRARTEESFAVLGSTAHDGEQKAALEKLRREVQAHWDPTEVILDWSPEERRAQRSAMLRQRVRRRQDIVELAAQVERLIASNFMRERARITQADREFRASIGWTTAVALFLGVCIAGATLARMISLERLSRAAESELRMLSGDLRSAQERERKYLSRELHDQVGQMLTGLRMELAGMARLLHEPESELGSRIARAKGTAEQTLRIVRNIAMLLRPSMLDDLGLTPALAWLVKEVSRSSGIEIQSEVDAAADALPDPHRTCLFRVVQEALTNAARHSAAARIQVSLHAAGGRVIAAVADDGRGFDPSADGRKGLGLLGMEERVRELGGTFRVVSAPGHGTRVEIRLPLPEAPHDSNPDRRRPRDRSDRVEASA